MKINENRCTMMHPRRVATSGTNNKPATRIDAERCWLTKDHHSDHKFSSGATLPRAIVIR